MSALCQKQTFAALFDHLVGADEKRLRNGQAERFRSLQIDRELKLRRLLDRKIGRIFALENALDILSSLPVVVEQIEVVDDQSAQFRYTAHTAINSWDAMTRGQIDKIVKASGLTIMPAPPPTFANARSISASSVTGAISTRTPLVSAAVAADS